MADTPRIDSVGQVLRQIREEAEMSLQELASKLGWDKGRLSKYENNHLNLSSSVIESIAQALGLPPSLLMLRCLQWRFPELRSSRTKTGKLVAGLLAELQRRER